MPDQPFQIISYLLNQRNSYYLVGPEPLLCSHCNHSYFAAVIPSNNDLFAECALCHHISLIFVQVTAAPSNLPDPN